MSIIKKLLGKFNGLHYRQEYLCLAKELFQNPIRAYFVKDAQIIKDITNEHLFTGYSPLIFTLTSCVLKEPFSNIEIVFSQSSFQPNEFFMERDALARLSLRLMLKQRIDNHDLYYYEGVRGHHHFLSLFHQYIVGLNNQLFNRKKGNVFLTNDLYKQVQIAY